MLVPTLTIALPTSGNDLAGAEVAVFPRPRSRSCLVASRRWRSMSLSRPSALVVLPLVFNDSHPPVSWGRPPR